MSRPPRGSRTSKQGLQRLLFADPEIPESQIGFTTRLLVAALPHSKPADNEFTRSSGFLDLCLLAPRRVGLPYGRYPRLACVWLITEAVRRRSPLLYLPRTFTQFAYQLGITPSSGQRGTLVQLREQLHRLVNVSISCLETRASDASFGLTPRFYAGGGVRPISKYLLWWDDPPPSSEARSYILLDTDFFQEVIAHPIPISLQVVQSFRSPLEMDVYMWLTWRSVRSQRLQRCGFRRKRPPVPIEGDHPSERSDEQRLMLVEVVGLVPLFLSFSPVYPSSSRLWELWESWAGVGGRPGFPRGVGRSGGGWAAARSFPYPGSFHSRGGRLWGG